MSQLLSRMSMRPQSQNVMTRMRHLMLMELLLVSLSDGMLVTARNG